jgi:UPF0755 protein
MSGRTPEEREAARVARERRRSERGGGTASTESAPEPEATAASGPASPAVPTAAPVPTALGEPEPIREPPDHLVALDGHGGELDDEPPAGTRRVSGVSRSRFTRQRSARPPGARRDRVRPSHSRGGRILSVVAIVLAAALIWFLVELFQPFHGSGHGAVRVTIPAHSSSSQVGDLLERDGVIASSFFFELRATLAGERSDLRPGTYHLRLGMSYGDVLRILTAVPTPAKVTNLTITEGRTRRQVDALLRSQGVRGSYLRASRRSRLLDPVRYGAPGGTPSLEGFLFPSTYQLREPITASALVADQLRTFRQRFAGVSLGYARSKHLSAYDVLTIASMVEAEAQTEHDRPLIASVIYNRLRDGMPLQIDATTRYATGNYTSPLTVSELSSSSPYNTRIHKGLPPTPIDNPGMASIQAAAHPANTSYLYFVVKPCGNGEQVFASTYAQFLAYAQQYQAARAKRGGRSPSHC